MNELIEKVKGSFSKLPPDKRRYAVIGAAAGILLAVSFAAMMVGNKVSGEKRVKPVTKAVDFYPLTGKDTGKLTADVMTERIKILETEMDRYKRGELPIPGDRQGSSASGTGKGEGSLNDTTLRSEVGTGEAMPGQLFAPGIVPPPVRKKNAQADSSIKAVAQPTAQDEPLFPSANGDNKGKGADPKGKPGTEAGVDSFPGEGAPSRKMQIREIAEDAEKTAEKAGLDKAFSSTNGNIQEQGLFMPSGSIISGVLITGMDAPTANQSRKDPFPVLLRIKDESILPNRMKMDIRECFLIASGFGDMSSERAMIRAETVSCVRHDGGVVETSLNAYAVGEDGKNGVRGRLVSKTGSLVAKSLMAGFLGGVADALKPQKIPTVNVASGSANQSQGFLNVDPEMVLNQGAMGGLNNSMNKIADYYLEMARSIFPIIEIDPGRKVDFIVIKGAKLAIQSGSKGNQQTGGNQRTNTTQRTQTQRSSSMGANPNSLNGSF